MTLQNKVALITGGAVRVGRALALSLAQQGVNIGLHYHKSKEKAQQVCDEIRSYGASAILLQGNFTKISDIERVVNQCHEHFKKIDILINNAAVYYRTPFGETTESQWDELFNINLKAPFFCAQFVSRYMKQQKSGNIINIADVAGIDPWSGFIPYSASKAGLISITKGMAKALAPHIRVNAIAPGTVIMREEATEEERKVIEQRTLLKRIGNPEDIVKTVLFILECDYLTGAVIAVDGGRLLV